MSTLRLFRASAGLAVASIVLVAMRRATPSPEVRPNSNTERAGVLRRDTLTVALEAKMGEWRADGDHHPSMRIEAFAEPGKAPLMPGPFVRVSLGTAIRFSVRNSLATPLTFFVPAAVRGGPDRLDAMDSVVVAPGAVGDIATKGVAPGNYIYRAMVPTTLAKVDRLSGLLTGAIVVDTANAPARPNDRVFVLMQTADSAYVANFAPNRPPRLDTLGRLLYTINGLSWPNTERLRATVGDSIHWRVINASAAPHPMHLHGFYYRVDSFTGPLVGVEGQGPPNRLVVTELMWPLTSMSLTWSPDRAGNWLFHCHWAVHLTPDSLSALPDDPHERDMVGLVLGVQVAARAGAKVVAAQQASAPSTTATRKLRLVAVEDSVPGERDFPLAVPSMRFVIDENGHRTEAPIGESPELDLVRGQPVAITIVNHLDEPTTVHWHGIEVEDSYVDGVAGFSGEGKHLAPDIAPGDSFVARFTPPRSGTFMYHAHMDDVRQQRAGMAAPLIVRDPGVAPSPDEHTFFLLGSRRGDFNHALTINGSVDSDTVVVHVGRPARLRILSLTWNNPTPLVSLVALGDTGAPGARATPVSWTPVAKDGFDLPASAQSPRVARQVISMGETYDYSFTPARAGLYALTVTPNPPPGVRVRPQVFARVVIRAE